jgi:hypothetical protein
LVHHQILAQMLELLEHFLHEQWHFCKAKDCHLAKIIIIMQILQRTFWEIMAQSHYILRGIKKLNLPYIDMSPKHSKNPKIF